MRRWNKILVSGLLVLGLLACLFLDKDRALGDEEERDILCVLPLAKVPDAEILAALEKVFGKQLKINVDKNLKVLILQGPEPSVTGAVQGLRDSIDISRSPEKRRDGDQPGAAGRTIEVVRLQKAKAETVAKLVKQYVSDKIEITERPNVSAVIFEGDGPLVFQAASLARQIDGQQIHPSLRRVLQPAGVGDGDRPRDPNRPRDGDRPPVKGDKEKPKGDGERPKGDGERPK